MLVVGADGCRGGWISATTDGSVVEFAFHKTLAGLVAASEAAERIAVDIPIGLAEGEPRDCDVEARKSLGERRSSVFPAPDRRVLETFVREDLTYFEANALSKKITGKGLSAQSYGILPKVSEADRLLTPKLQKRVVEVHPELSFLALAGHPMRFAKKKPGGFDERLSSLAERFPGLGIGSRSEACKICRHAQPDDVLDAAAAAASAWRLANGEALRIPRMSQIDARGLRMEMVF